MEQEIKDCMLCEFRLNLCKGMPENDFQSLFSLTVRNSYKKGEVILKQGIKTHHLVYLNKGIVKFVHEENGRELIITIDKSPTLLGLANILNEGVNLFSIVAIEECDGCLIDINRLKLLLMKNQEFMFNIMSISTKMFRKSVFNFISLAHKQVNGRIADILIYLSQEIYASNNFQLTLSRQELAEFAGCSKENVIHTLRKFDADGIIKVSSKSIEIIDSERLLKISKTG